MEQKWRDFERQIDTKPFCVSTLLNRQSNASAMIDSGCLTYGLISESVVSYYQLQRIPIVPRIIEGWDGRGDSSSQAIAHLTVDIGGQPSEVYLFIVSQLDYDIILGRPWMKDQRVTFSFDHHYLVFESGAYAPRTDVERQIDLCQVGAPGYWLALRHARRKQRTQIFAASMTDIEKALKTKTYSNPREKLPSHYHEFLDVFNRKDADRLPPHRGLHVDHRIDLEPGTNPPWGPLYNMSRDELLVLRKTLTDLLDKGFIRVSNSPAAAPVLFAKKPGGGLRFCVDYRGLNHISRKDRYPLPRINETFERISRAKWFTKLDVISAFHKIRIQEGDEWKTAFRTRYGLFEWLVTPFGLANAPSTFQKYVNWTLRDFLDEFASAYLDDILIFSDGSLTQHREHVRKVLGRLREAGLQIDIDKCEFEVQSTKYLGYIVEAEKGIRMDPDKINAVLDWESPTTVKGVRGFLGFANFYRRFIRDFAKITRPLTDLTRKDAEVEFRWTDKAEQAFQTLKRMFVTAPNLLIFDPDRETVLETDSSGYSTGGVLMQYDDEGMLRPCAFMSKKNLPAECNYPIYDKELLAIIKCLQEWDSELRSVESFKILTDHKALQYFATVRKLSERQCRWSELLSGFRFTIHYRPGAANGVADALSRREQDLPKKGDVRTQARETALLGSNLFSDTALRPGTIHASPIRIHIATQRHPLQSTTSIHTTRTPPGQRRPQDQLEHQTPAAAQRPRDADSARTSDPRHGAAPREEYIEGGHSVRPPLEEQIREAWGQDVVIQQLYDAVRAKKPRFPPHLQVKVSISDCGLDHHGRLLYRGRRWVPDSEPLRTRIMEETHDSPIVGHPGHNGLYHILSRSWFWPGLAVDVRRLTRNCTICRSASTWRERYQGLLKPLPVPERMWRDISVDFIVGLPESQGCRDVVVITDRLSKGVILEPIPSLSAETFAETFLKTFYRFHGLPSSIVSDRGKQFVGRLWRRICQMLQISRRLSTAWHPETDGSTERAIQTVKSYLRKYVNYAQDNWASLLPSAELAYNSHDAASTGVSPFFLSHGYNIEPLDLVDEPRHQTTSRSPIQRAESIVLKLRDARDWAQSALAIAQQRQEDHANRSREPATQYHPGDRVWLNLQNIATDRPSRTLDHRAAQFTVLEPVGSHSYRLDTPPGIHDVFHTSLLRPAARDPLPSQTIHEPQPPAILGEDDEPEWEIDNIIRERTSGRQRQFLVKWTGYTRPTWEPASALQDTTALDRYETARRYATRSGAAP